MESLRLRLGELLPAELAEILTSSTALIVVGATLFLCTFASCRICAKAGYPSILGLLLLLPVINVMLLLGLAFGSWPMEEELRSLRTVERAVRRADQKHLRRVA